MLRLPGFCVPAFLVAQTVFVHWAAGNERRPTFPDTALFPSELEGWKQFQEQPIEPNVAAELGADRYLNREYAQSSSGTAVNLFLAWYASQRGGEKQPHSPKVCLPAAGWIAGAADQLSLNTKAGPIQVNRYLIQNGAGTHGIVLYWYQTPRRVTAGEWSAKLWLVADALRDKRTDVALVRIFVRSSAGGDPAATAVASSFATSIYPELRNYLPR